MCIRDRANTALITYKEEQAGYLAGYAAVYDGYKAVSYTHLQHLRQPRRAAHCRQPQPGQKRLPPCALRQGV